MAKPYLSVLAISLAVTGAMLVLRPELHVAAVALIYLLLVFLTGIWWGRWPSRVASLFAFFSLNYVFTVPHFTFAVDTPQETVSLVVFLLVAEVTSRLDLRVREQEMEAQERAWEASTLHALSAAITTSGSSEEALQALPLQIVDALGVQECALYLPQADGVLRRRAVASKFYEEATVGEEAPGPAVQAFVTREPVEDTALFLPLAVGPNVVGVLYVRPAEGAPLREPTRRVLRTFAGQAAAFIERLQLQQEAAEAEALRRTDELKTSLLSAVSHELRTPLASIRMTATALMKRDVRWSESDRLEMLESIDSATARLSRLVSNLLDLSRLEGGVLHPVKEWCDLREVVTTAVDHMPTVPGEPHPVEVNLPPDLPLVLLDFIQIENVIVNLLENAARHAVERTPIKITVSRRDGEAIVQVANEGPSIPPQAVSRIFDRFYTLPGSRGLTGLGLAICKGLVEAHGGRIWVEAPGESGARFAFALPLGETPADVGERPQKALP